MITNSETTVILPNPESRAGAAGALLGGSVGSAAVIYYLNDQINTANHTISQVQENAIDHEGQAQQPPAPNPYVEGAAVVGSISFFGMAAVTLACVLRERARKREHDAHKRNAERAQVRRIEDTVSKELGGIDTVEWHANNSRGQES